MNRKVSNTGCGLDTTGYQYAFTVFTPTYNRRHVLPRVYDSLRNQTFKNFEWLIVDDGSTDGTSDLVEVWKKEADFPIRYYYQTNRGKHFAFNRAVKEARGELFLPLDSDDACIPAALEKLKKTWDSIPVGQRQFFSGVTALCMDERGMLIGDRFPKDMLDSDALEIRYRFRVKGEKWGFTRTDVLKEFPFPEIEGTHYISEAIVWNAIAEKYKTRFINEILRVYYLHDQDTNSLSRLNPARDAACNVPYLESLLNNNIKWIVYDFRQFLIYAVLYCRYSFHLNRGILSQMRSLHNIISLALWLVSLPGGVYLYLKDTRR